VTVSQVEEVIEGVDTISSNEFFLLVRKVTVLEDILNTLLHLEQWMVYVELESDEVHHAGRVTLGVDHFLMAVLAYHLRNRKHKRNLDLWINLNNLQQLVLLQIEGGATSADGVQKLLTLVQIWRSPFQSHVGVYLTLCLHN
jgi:hypothetical protein